MAPAILTGILSDFEATADLVCGYAYGPSATEQLKRLGRQRLLKTPPEVLHGDYAACDAFDVMVMLEKPEVVTRAISKFILIKS